jgi:WD repeat-containing protein 1 (actin-interacting protein 1)
MGPDASNACLPVSSPVTVSIPPTPSTERGERCCLDGRTGRFNSGANKGVVAYTSGKSVVVRNLLPQSGIATLSSNPDASYADTLPLLPHTTACKLPVLVYRGHNHAATACKLAPSGCYVASGDERGSLRVWALDHEEHLAKYETTCLTGPIRDLDWDGESKRIAIGGERSLDGGGSSSSADCCKALQWDTGVTVGQLANHIKGRCASLAVKPNRPFRIITAGKEDKKTYFHAGPPFQKVPPVDGIPEENAHAKGAVNCVRYSNNGNFAVSVGSDRSLCVYDGKTLKLLQRLENIHAATIYSCAWSSNDASVLTASGDGTCKLFSVVAAADGKLALEKTWKPAEAQLGKAYTKVPVGGNQVGCTFVSDQDIPICVGLNGQISILPRDNCEDVSLIQVLTGHDAPIAGLAVDDEHDVFYTGDTNGILCQWKLSTGQPMQRLAPGTGNDDLMFVVHTGAISGLAVVKGSLLSVGWDDRMNVTIDKSGKLDPTPISLGAQPNAISTGTDLAVICTVKGLLLYKKSSDTLSDLIPIGYAAQATCVTKNDKTVYVGGDDCKIHIYEVQGNGKTLKETKVIENGHLKPIHAFALSNDETKLASADTRDVCVFDVSSGGDYKALVAKGRWCFHVQRITCLTWSPDDAIIASGGADDSIYLWNLEKKMKRIHYPFAHRGGLTGLQFHKTSTNGSSSTSLKLVSVGNDAVVNQWDVTKDVQEKFS